tara:strand:- start:1742 stop:3001 length:1260 start_codon:yes stop_codon:yes gene_type:complete
MTWNEDGVRDHRASDHPATPDEGASHPASQPDHQDAPSGSPSEWGEDVHPGPYAESEPPSLPGYEGKSAGVDARLERKAAKCIRLSAAMLGPDATVEAIEDQALAFMDLDDRAIKASLSRIADDDDDDDDDDEVVEEEEVEEASKKKANRLMRLEDRLARLESAAGRAGGRGDFMSDDEAKTAEWEAGHRAPGGWDPGEEESMGGESKGDQSATHLDYEESMLRSMLKEEGMGHDESESMDDEEAMLMSMLKEEGMEYASEDPGDFDTATSEMAEEEELAASTVSMGDDMLVADEVMVDPVGDMMEEEVVVDPMGVMAMDDDEEAMLRKLYGAEDKKEKEDHDEGAVKDDEDHIEALEEDKAEEKKDLKKEEKKASLKPQPRKASKGAKTLGGVSKAASSEVSSLSQLWESAPDVSKFF